MTIDSKTKEISTIDFHINEPAAIDFHKKKGQLS